MVKDLLYDKTKGKCIIEVLITDGDYGVWVPVMPTKLHLVTKEGDLKPITEIRARKLKKE